MLTNEEISQAEIREEKLSVKILHDPKVSPLILCPHYSSSSLIYEILLVMKN